MPFPDATDLIGLGFTVQLANVIGGTDPAPSLNDLTGSGMPAEQAVLLAEVAYGSRPTKADLIGKGMKAEFANQLGQ